MLAVSIAPPPPSHFSLMLGVHSGASGVSPVVDTTPLCRPVTNSPSISSSRRASSNLGQGAAPEMQPLSLGRRLRRAHREDSSSCGEATSDSECEVLLGSSTDRAGDCTPRCVRPASSESSASDRRSPSRTLLAADLEAEGPSEQSAPGLRLAGLQDNILWERIAGEAAGELHSGRSSASSGFGHRRGGPARAAEMAEQARRRALAAAAAATGVPGSSRGAFGVGAAMPGGGCGTNQATRAAQDGWPTQSWFEATSHYVWLLVVASPIAAPSGGPSLWHCCGTTEQAKVGISREEATAPVATEARLLATACLHAPGATLLSPGARAATAKEAMPPLLPAAAMKSAALLAATAAAREALRSPLPIPPELVAIPLGPRWAPRALPPRGPSGDWAADAVETLLARKVDPFGTSEEDNYGEETALLVGQY